MLKNFLGFLYFVIAILVLIALLKVFNWLPMAIQKDTMRRYKSIEEISSKLNLKDIYVPSYFPLSFRWPPSDLLAQGKPFTAIIMEFKHVERGDTALIISQVAVGANLASEEKIKISQIKDRVRYSLKGRDAVLMIGACKNDEPCSQISWNEGEYNMTVIMKSPPSDLIKVAKSMIY